jgi:Ni/Co efflux regulator RcnB
MKKLIVSMIVSAFMLAPMMSMAQDAKPAEKAKKECCKGEKKECTKEEKKACEKDAKKECCKKGEKKACCAKEKAAAKK